MEQFPHLKFVQKVIGKPRFFGGGNLNSRTQENKQNRRRYSSYLSNITSHINQEWEKELSEREGIELPPLDSNIIPVFLQINPDLITNKC
ncbi:hypothetical protein [Sunxiuqinia indica]|uniref:hypothetical protein n=1 Tax=Sunxiuqinia indica TaxID=2692584 RepID=UPI00135863C5|nr:hypothetical protein [Sunxiuqinia indica]